jgi:SET domain-containing protein
MPKKLEVRKSSIYGKGCFALVPFARRKKIAAYAGEMLQGKRRINRRQEAQSAPKIISINEELAIDGAAGGDETAYINHSCEPNAYMRAAPGNKVLFFALRDIQAGEEITINYRDPEHPLVCKCGAQSCRSNSARQA